MTELFGDGKNIGWTAAMNKVRVDLIRQRYELEKKDPLVALIIEVYDDFLHRVTDPQIMSSFKQQVYNTGCTCLNISKLLL